MPPMPCGPMMMPKSQIAFISPESMQVQFEVGGYNFESTPLVVPARYNFGQGAIYRLKLSNIAGHPGLELYPTIEVAPAMPRTEAYLAHNAIPIQFTPEDFEQILTGNFVTKVIYLPDPEYQELAIAGVETLVSTRLDPGVDPIIEADRRGAILTIVRIGNKDLGMPEGEAEFLGGAPFAVGLPNPGPQWGMPSTGTQIGLPGPPHVQLGGPAGLQSHTIRNHTHYHMPEPVQHMNMHVRERPGYSYPQPVSTVHVSENNNRPLIPVGPHPINGPPNNVIYGVGGNGEYCPPQ